MREDELPRSILGELGFSVDDPGDTARLEIVERLATGLITASTIQEVIDVAHLSLKALVDPVSFSAFMPVGESVELQCVAVSSSAAPEYKEYLGLRVPPDSMVADVFSRGSVLISKAPHRDPRLRTEHRAILEGLGVELFMAMPMRVIGRTVGVLVLSWMQDSPDMSSVDPILEVATAYVALAIDRIVHVEATAESSARNQAVIYSLAEGLVTTDSRGRIVNWNRAMEAMSGRPEHEVLGLRATDELQLTNESGNAVELESHPVRVVLEERNAESFVVDELFLESGDERIPVVVEVSAVVEGPTLYGAVAVVRDTRRERELDQLRDSLISTVSHELRTPLTMVQGFAELLEDESLSDEDHDLAVRQINDAAQRLGDLIDDILSTAAIQSGRMELIREVVNCAEIVDGAMRSFSPSARERVVRRVDERVEIVADRDRCEQILTNLIGNALKYSGPDGEVVIDCGREGDSVVFRVTDSGIGISAADLAQLFEKFYRSRDSRVRHLPGTGLGLFISRHIAELHGGEIFVESELGRGTSATVRLPIDGSGGATPPE